MTSGKWPGLILTDGSSSENYGYKNIVNPSNDYNSNYDSESNLRGLYSSIKYAEAKGGRIDDNEKTLIYNGMRDVYYSPEAGEYKEDGVQDGLYLVSAIEKDGIHPDAIADIQSEARDKTKNYYTYALSIAAGCSSTLNASSDFSFLGSNTTEGIHKVNYKGTCVFVNTDSNCVIAPAFNLDVSKVSVKIIDGKRYLVPNKIELGGKYEIGGYNWICVDTLADDVYVMQYHSSGSSGDTSTYSWPGYEYNNRSAYNNNFAYKDIALSINWESIGGTIKKIRSFYNDWLDNNSVGGSIEADGGRIDDVAARGSVTSQAGKYVNKATRDGLYLISKEGVVNDYYRFALKQAAASNDKDVWLGTSGANSGYAYSLNRSTANISYTSQSTYCVIAPAFNLDGSKVNVNGGVITKKVS